MDAMTMCQFTAIEEQSQYDDDRRIHADAIPDLYLPEFHTEAISDIPWDDEQCSLEVEEL